MDTWEMIDGERRALVDLSDALTPAQWDAQSLCTAWRVRDVISHVIDGSVLSGGQMMLLLTKHGFRVGSMLEKEAIKGGNKSTDELRVRMRGTIGRRSKPPGAKPADLLLDYVVHQQDIRRPLGVTREVPADHVRGALDKITLVRNGFLPGKSRAAGLHLHATDMEWERGEGPEVAGSGEAILMVLAGRGAALAELSGPGVDTLRARIGA